MLKNEQQSVEVLHSYLRVSRFFCSVGSCFANFCVIFPNALPLTKAGDIKSHSSVRPSVHHKNFNLAHIFWSINDRELIFGMHDPCDRPFQLTRCRDLDLDIWLTSRSHLLPGGGPQFSEFACLSKICGDVANYSMLSVQSNIKIEYKAKHLLKCQYLGDNYEV